jgi:DNA-binding transcriptional MerR regulator
MPVVRERPHLSIGEVLALLQDEYPDVTISKIRFLESQGLLDPERTPSGYRKFYEEDIDRLRWILTQQKEHFLPLKVIKDRLAERDRAAEAGPGGEVAAVEPAGVLGRDEDGEGPVPIWMADVARSAAARGEPSPIPTPTSSGADQPEGRPRSTAAAGSAARSASSARSATGRPSASAETVADRPGGNDRRSATPLDSGPTSVSLTLDELASASVLRPQQLRELEQFGLIEGRSVGAEVFYDGDALVVAQKAAGFLRHGIEARHLRMFKVAAEREAGFLEQVVMPMMKQRNPDARHKAVATLGELAALGQSLRAALLRNALRDYLP